MVETGLAPPGNIAAEGMLCPNKNSCQIFLPLMLPSYVADIPKTKNLFDRNCGSKTKDPRCLCTAKRDTLLFLTDAEPQCFFNTKLI